MPLTGNQANILRIQPTDDEIDPWTINQIILALNGSFGIRARLIGYNHPSNYALELRNPDGTTGLCLLCYDNNGATLFEVRKALTTVGPQFKVVGSGGATQIDADAGGVVLRPLLQVTNGTFLSLQAQASDGVTARPELHVNNGTIEMLKVLAATGATIRPELHVTDGTTEYITATPSGGLVTSPVFTAWGTSHWVLDAVEAGVTARPAFTVQTFSATLMTVSNSGVDFRDMPTVGGNPISGSAVVSYTGNGGTSARQITCGFAPKFAVITGGAVVEMYHLSTSSGNNIKTVNGASTWVSSCALHATDGVTVANGNTDGNVNAKGYILNAFR